MIRYFLPLPLCFLIASPLQADPLRQEITDIRKQKEALLLEQKKLMTEVSEAENMIQDLSRLYQEKEKSQEEHRNEISHNP